eukprot:TRINITY_DN72606_c0_g1_i1.p1 TRINITY_DN72606_c0_g1~~TRINITY_DN72606_c0_g1_i1.p1  ORF type:complete len:885 (+),score=81.81 TRINITY_DN72606_c0_g1_i1:71-2725(+)
MAEPIRRLLQVLEQYPILSEAASVLDEGLSGKQPIPHDVDARKAPFVELPVALLRWTQSSISKDAHFLHDKSGKRMPEEDRTSIWQTLDQLFYGHVAASELEPLEVVIDEGKVWSLSNRRLTVLKMFQAVRQDTTVFAKCVVRPIDDEYRRKKDTQSDGLSIYPRLRHAEGKHLGAPLFNQAEQGRKSLMRLAGKHPDLDALFRQIMICESMRRQGEDTLTLASDPLCENEVGRCRSRERSQSKCNRKSSRSRTRKVAQPVHTSSTMPNTSNFVAMTTIASNSQSSTMWLRQSDSTSVAPDPEDNASEFPVQQDDAVAVRAVQKRVEWEQFCERVCQDGPWVKILSINDNLPAHSSCNLCPKCTLCDKWLCLDDAHLKTQLHIRRVQEERRSSQPSVERSSSSDVQNRLSPTPSLPPPPPPLPPPPPPPPPPPQHSAHSLSSPRAHRRAISAHSECLASSELETQIPSRSGRNKCMPCIVSSDGQTSAPSAPVSRWPLPHAPFRPDAVKHPGREHHAWQPPLEEASMSSGSSTPPPPPATPPPPPSRSPPESARESTQALPAPIERQHHILPRANGPSASESLAWQLVSEQDFLSSGSSSPPPPPSIPPPILPYSRSQRQESVDSLFIEPLPSSEPPLSPFQPEHVPSGCSPMQPHTEEDSPNSSSTSPPIPPPPPPPSVPPPLLLPSQSDQKHVDVTSTQLEPSPEFQFQFSSRAPEPSVIGVSPGDSRDVIAAENIRAIQLGNELSALAIAYCDSAPTKSIWQNADHDMWAVLADFDWSTPLFIDLDRRGTHGTVIEAQYRDIRQQVWDAFETSADSGQRVMRGSVVVDGVQLFAYGLGSKFEARRRATKAALAVTLALRGDQSKLSKLQGLAAQCSRLANV